MLKKWYGEYLSLLKMIEVEEILDLIFYRPLAFILVKLLQKTNVTPNQITFVAIIWSLIGAVLYTKHFLILAGIFFILYDVFDCADGMVARLKHNGTPLGRVIDGFADYIATIAAYLAIGFEFAENSSDPQLYWGLLALAGASNIFHAVSLDYYRNRYLDYAFDRKSTFAEDLAEYRNDYKKLKANGGHYFSRLLYVIYFAYSKLQSKLTAKKDIELKKIYKKEEFLKINKVPIKLWTFIGPTTEWTFLLLCVITGRLEIFIWGMIIVFNAYAIFMHIFQTYIDSKIEKVIL
jgi:phosphatidylglycerophosphate synthase